MLMLAAALARARALCGVRAVCSSRAVLADAVAADGAAAPSASASAAGAPMKLRVRRFYRHVTVDAVSDAAATSTTTPASAVASVAAAAAGVRGFRVKLDGRNVRTPLKALVTLPNEAIAWVVAAEWAAQRTYIEDYNMPVTALVCTAIDRIPQTRSSVIDSMLSHMTADVLCFESGRDVETEYRRSAVDPLLERVANALGVGAPIAVSRSLMPPKQPASLAPAVRAYLERLPAWHLAAAQSVAGTCKSTLLGVAATLGQWSAADIVRAARVEENVQLLEWSRVPGAHDLDEASLLTTVGAAQVVSALIPT